MNILIILGHPDKKSFNHAIAEACKAQVESNGHIVFFHDLYAEKFNPLHQINSVIQNADVDEDIKIHCSHLEACDGIIVIHPNWWGQPPAIIKGWLDRVLLPGVAYDFKLENGRHLPIGLLKSKKGIVLNTSNSISDIENDPLNLIWRNRVFEFCGIDENESRNFGNVKESTDIQRSEWLLEVRQLINTFFPSLLNLN